MALYIPQSANGSLDVNKKPLQCNVLKMCWTSTSLMCSQYYFLHSPLQIFSWNCHLYNSLTLYTFRVRNASWKLQFSYSCTVFYLFLVNAGFYVTHSAMIMWPCGLCNQLQEFSWIRFSQITGFFFVGFIPIEHENLIGLDFSPQWIFNMGKRRHQLVTSKIALGILEILILKCALPKSHLKTCTWKDVSYKFNFICFIF